MTSQPSETPDAPASPDPLQQATTELSRVRAALGTATGKLDNLDRKLAVRTRWVITGALVFALTAALGAYAIKGNRDTIANQQRLVSCGNARFHDFVSAIQARSQVSNQQSAIVKQVFDGIGKHPNPASVQAIVRAYDTASASLRAVKVPSYPVTSC